jgi:TonB family protein
VLFNALVVAAMTACASVSAPVQSADALFMKADTAIAAHDVPSARIDYESGMQQLAATPWFVGDKSCDPPHYTLERYVTTLHSLVVAVATGEMTPLDAYDHENDIRTQLFKTLPKDASQYFYFKYPDLSARESDYVRAIAASSRPDLIAAHSPDAGKCTRKDVGVEILDQARPDYPDSLQNDGIGKVTVSLKVQIDAAGKIMYATISQSSGVMELDQAALSAARRSLYLPAVKDCRRVSGWFDFSVTFDPSG